MRKRYLLATPGVDGVDWRRMRQLLVVVMAFVVAMGSVWLADAGYERACSSEQMNGRRAGVCGSHLGDLLRVVCRSGYNKRSTDCEHSLSICRMSLR